MSLERWMFVLMMTGFSVGLLFLGTGCTVKLVQISPDAQLERDLGIYRKGLDDGEIKGYNQGTKDTLEMMEFLDQFSGEEDGYIQETPKDYY